MKKRLSNFILIAVFFVGLSVLLYPTISNYWNSVHQSRAIASYEEKLANFTQADYTAYFQAAQRYNASLLNRRVPMVNGDPISQEYISLLNVTNDGEMGYITIKSLGVQLPIYHGTGEAVLAAGAGHLEGSSLPVGDIGTHSIITGHRGLPSAKLFTDLDKMELGDTFTITVLNTTLTYQVDNISIVLPEDDSLLKIEPDKDYVTLVTCTPYAINTHRLLVRGVRTANAAGEARVAADAVQIDSVIVAPVVAAPMLLILLVLLVTGTSRKKKSRGLPGGKDGEAP